MTNVTVSLTAEVGGSPENLEADAFRVLEAVEEQAQGIVEGAAVACNFATKQIELDFSVESVSSSEVHQRVALVLAIIEREVPIARELGSQTVSADAEKVCV